MKKKVNYDDTFECDCTSCIYNHSSRCMICDFECRVRLDMESEGVR